MFACIEMRKIVCAYVIAWLRYYTAFLSRDVEEFKNFFKFKIQCNILLYVIQIFNIIK